MKRTVIISAYKHPEKLEENLERLEGFEVILAVDEPDDELLQIIERYGLKATVSHKRRGKWKALNDAVEMAEGEYLLFLDSDTLLINPGNPESFDGLEIKKEVDLDSRLSRLVNIDYFNMYLVSLIAARLGICLGFNGAAFWIRKEVLKKLGGFRRRINEDTDLGIRFGISGYRFGVDGFALTDSPHNIRDWLSQRERWALGGAEVLMENFREIIRKPAMWVPAIVILFPSILPLILGIAIPDGVMFKLLFFILPSFGVISGKMSVLVLYLLYGYHVLRNLILILLTFSVWAALMIVLSKVTGFRIDFRYLPVYYFIYSPMWMSIAIIALARQVLYRIVKRKITLSGWKV
ncbi:glycosyltransferase [Geoglobus acetivorans]|uniref:Glycosyl transferase n=1 Tax=Geoglobus acetivorans TaxID=565033 RepID=A0A0A7GBE8_GEOAI|nr:glycosyl transferase [Geoglobus acetivorans]